jgi:hypothetical protein
MAISPDQKSQRASTTQMMEEGALCHGNGGGRGDGMVRFVPSLAVPGHIMSSTPSHLLFGPIGFPEGFLKGRGFAQLDAKSDQ